MDHRSWIAAGCMALLAAGCSATADSPEPQAPPAAQCAAGALPRLVFFMNPNGAPCQAQERILRELAPELSGRAELVYVRTTEAADIPQFGRYGIRALPSLVLTDRGGRELRRATPGIQSAEQIRRLLGP
jgi:thioredoxin-like negative regulator of GroEL